MNPEQLDALLDLLRPAPQNEGERDHLRAQLGVEIEFLKFALESKSVLVALSERFEEVERIRDAGQALLNLPDPLRARFEVLGKALMLFASEKETPLKLLRPEPKRSGRPLEEQRYFFMKRCVAFLEENNKIASMHRAGSGAKFVKSLWDLLRPTDKIELAGWATAWRRYKKAPGTIDGANKQGVGA